MIKAKVQQIKDYLHSQSIAVCIKEDSGLSLENPGSYKAGLIKIFDCLPPELVPEAEAHELCHAILEYKGVLSIDINGNYGAETFSGDKPDATTVADIVKQLPELDFEIYDITNVLNDELTKYCDLSEKISNAIHHKIMMPLLRDDFGIVPCGYYSLMQRWLAKTETEISSQNHDTICNYTHGVFLYDIFNVLTSETEEIARIASINSEVLKAYQAAMSHLDRLDVSASLSEQFKVVCDFFTTLGIEKERYTIYDFYNRI